MRIIKKILKYLLILLIIPLSYIIIALILSFITVNKCNNDLDKQSDRIEKIYLNTNGVHLYIIMPVHNISNELLDNLIFSEEVNYFSFGWGDENFYLNTPEWSDLTFSNAFTALFLRTASLIHVKRYEYFRESWIEIEITKSQLKKLNRYIYNSFEKNTDNEKILLPDSGHSINDNFYKATGYYTLFNTCNSWVNRGFRKSGLKASLWTPFDFPLIKKYN